MNKNWISVWGNAMSIAENRPEGYGKNITLRYPVFSPFEGEKIRLTFDNYCGTEPITISKVTICQNHKFYPVTCNGETSFTLSAGSAGVTDPLDLSICANETLEISFYLADYTQLRSAVFASGPYSEGLYATGDQTENPDISMDISRKINMFYSLRGICAFVKLGFNIFPSALGYGGNFHQIVDVVSVALQRWNSSCRGVRLNQVAFICKVRKVISHRCR